MVEVHVPRKILESEQVSRTIVFRANAMFKSLELIQKVISFSSQMYLHDTLIEVHKFKFGFVIPNTENSWENIIIARPKAEMIPAEVLSGNLIVESEFFNNEKNVYKFKAQVFYD